MKMASNEDWFAKKLGQQNVPQQGRPNPTPAMPPSQQPLPPMPQFQQTAPPAPPSSFAVATCPDCGSGNYAGSNNNQARCFDCGYPVSQSGSKYGGLSTARIEGGIGEAMGNNKSNNYNPQGIIGRIQ
jgi:ribosomal protein L37E